MHAGLSLPNEDGLFDDVRGGPTPLDKRVTGVGGDPALIVLKAGHHDVALHSPVCTPAEERNQINAVKL